MKTEIKLSESIGKTLQAVEFSYDGQCVIVFEDGTFTTLGIDFGYEKGDAEIAEESLDVLDFGDDQLIKVGIATKDELDAMRIAKNAKHVALCAERDRQEFERLKKLFGN